MTAGHSTDLGVEVVGGWPVHKRECDECQGEGRLLIEVGPPHAPRDHYEQCERCRGEGFTLDDGCDCEVCAQLAEDAERDEDLRKARAI